MKTSVQRGLGTAAAWLLAAGALALASAVRHRDAHLRGDEAAAVTSHAPAEAAASPAPAEAAVNRKASGGSLALAWQIYEEVTRDRVLLVSAGITFYALLALFPGITALVSVYGLLADPDTVTSELAKLSGLLPSEAVGIITDQSRRIAAERPGNLSVGFLAGLVISMWTASSGMKSVFEGLNVAYNQHDRRSFVYLSWLALLFTAGAISLVLTAIAVIVAAPAALEFLGIGGVLAPALRWGRWPALLLVTMAGIGVLYRFGPDRRMPRRHWISPGGVVAALVWLVVSGLFSWFVANFGNYNRIYGSLGAVIAFMVWLWMSSIIVLVGAELDAVLERNANKTRTRIA